MSLYLTTLWQINTSSVNSEHPTSPAERLGKTMAPGSKSRIPNKTSRVLLNGYAPPTAKVIAAVTSTSNVWKRGLRGASSSIAMVDLAPVDEGPSSQTEDMNREWEKELDLHLSAHINAGNAGHTTFTNKKALLHKLLLVEKEVEALQRKKGKKTATRETKNRIKGIVSKNIMEQQPCEVNNMVGHRPAQPQGGRRPGNTISQRSSVAFTAAIPAPRSLNGDGTAISFSVYKTTYAPAPTSGSTHHTVGLAHQYKAAASASHCF
ncbi:hypothetical protein NE237_003151 [Protea cynaroides]|uniref:Uncharacterized protein n=1 Tax=Protea cynaroides TaxID=273540 RepID=A0A9Q0KGE6_9MAGN|nr:hypothetical protein NE237_003151 [Protea cynaroides]